MPDLDATRQELVVIRCMLGERAALDELAAAWQGPLWGYLRRMVDSDAAAEDASQETWVRVLRGLPRLRDPSRFAPWFYGIARRVLMDRLRAAYATREEPHASLDEHSATEPEAVDAEEIERLAAELGRLPLAEREALTLFYLQGLSIRAVAEVVGVPEGTVKSRLHRAKRLLREQFTRKQGGLR